MMDRVDQLKRLVKKRDKKKRGGKWLLLFFYIYMLLKFSMYNAGQSCCAIERVYVHKFLYEEFCEKVKQTQTHTHTQTNTHKQTHIYILVKL